jgi:hypothetical protein
MSSNASPIHITLYIIIILYIMYFYIIKTTEVVHATLHPDHIHLKESVNAIIDERNKDRNYLKSMCGGILRGTVVGYLTGGPHNAIISGSIFGVISPIMTHLGF